MNIIILNIPKYKKILSEEISALFHDMNIISIFISGNKMTMVIKRPCYEQAKEQKLLKFISMYRIPSVKTVINIAGIKSIRKEEENDKNCDWFLSFDIDEEKSCLIVRGVLNTYFLEYSDETKIDIKDQEKEDWSDYSLSFQKTKERNEKAIADLTRKVLQNK